MINFTIDASVFYLEQENDDLCEEYKNLQQFILNIFYLQLLDTQPSVTVSYLISKYILNDFIKDNEKLKQNLKSRINKVKEKYTLEKYNQTLLDYYDEIYNMIIKKYKTNIKTGIYENILNDEELINENYRYITFDENNYPYTKHKYLLNNFKQNLGIISELNNKYYSTSVNCIIIGGNENYKTSLVSIIGIQKSIRKYKILNYETIDLCNIIKENNCDNIIFGKQISLESLMIIKEKHIHKENDVLRLYNYVKALDDIVGVIKENKIDIDEKNLSIMSNVFGCLCTTERERHENCKYSYRYFENNDGKKEYFSLHLKPITDKKYLGQIRNKIREGIKYNYTLRIYFKIKNQKFLIGWIGEHLIACEDCSHQFECDLEKHGQ